MTDKENQHEWVEGKGLEDGWPDINWTGASGPIVIYSKLVEEVEYDDNFVVQRRYMKRLFTCKIRWGDAWKHAVFVEDSSLLLALQEGIRKAVENGCPPEWVDRAPYNDPNPYSIGDDC